VTAPGRQKIETVGRAFNDSISYAGGLGYLGYDTAAWTLRALVGRPPISGQSLAVQMVRVGVKAVPIIILVHLFIGMILPLEMAPILSQYNMQSNIAVVQVKAVFPQLAPIFSAIVLAGFAGAAIAAELGTMVVSEEIAALKTMALDPVRYLVVPRVLACMAMLVCLTVIASLSAWLGGLFVYGVVLGSNPMEYYQMSADFLLRRDIFSGLIKSLIFATLVGLIACHEGLKVSGGAEGVGRATTRSVVFAIVAIIASNMILTIVFFYFYRWMGWN
jgi:phospholipid/cholesterol/gamma-HCH transport system permease protein